MTYKHTQHSHLKFLLYALAVGMCLTGWMLRAQVPFFWLFPIVGALMLVLAGSFHHLTVADAGDRLSIAFGPLPLFKRSIHYNEIVRVEPARTSLLDGWGIHLSLRGGWVWNLSGQECVLIRIHKKNRYGKLWLGTDDVDRLVQFLQSRTNLVR